jgi:hypothetical protein
MKCIPSNLDIYGMNFEKKDLSVEMEGNAIKSGQQFVPTTVSWCSLNQLARNSRYCEVVMLDATGGTNSQKRPVVLVVSIDGAWVYQCIL